MSEGDFDRALLVALKQRAKSQERRTAMSMAQLRRDQGKRVRLASFSPWSMVGLPKGFDTRDLKQAKALLEKFST